MWEISIFTGLYGTGHGQHGICPVFTGPDRDREQFDGISVDGKGGFQNSTGSHGTIRYPVESFEIFTAEKIPRKALLNACMAIKIAWHD